MTGLQLKLVTTQATFSEVRLQVAQFRFQAPGRLPDVNFREGKIIERGQK